MSLPPRIPRHVYADPLDRIWLTCAERIGFQVTRSPDVYASTDGRGTLIIGAEATLYQTIGNMDFSATAGAFGFNDTSGTLLSFRGWALHDIKSTLFGQFPLPPLSPFMQTRQEAVTRSVIEIDDRVGFYGRFEWRPSPSVVLNAFYYDNRGDPEAFTESLQWGWRTRFWNVGAMASLGDSTEAKSQVMWGNTLVGPDTPWGIPVDVDFTTAYLLVSRTIGSGKLTARGDWFETYDNSYVAEDDNNEDGWSAMIAYKAELTDFATLVVEVLHVSSDRPGRQLYGGIDADQSQTSVQSALRFGF